MKADMSWWDQALCAQVGGDLFFPDKGERGGDAKQVCARCDVRAQCLAYAMTVTDLRGVWGGLSPRQRARAGAPYTIFGSSFKAVS